MASSSSSRSTPSRSSASAAASQQGIVPRLRAALYALLWPFLGLLRFLLTGRLRGSGEDFDGLSAAVTAKASQNFVDYLRSFQQQAAIGVSGSSSNGNSNNNNSHQAWLTTGFAAAQEQATQQQSLLLVYLHSPLHRSSESFCKQVLCHEAMSNFINQPNITAFGVSIHTAQGAYLAQMLQASSYPFLALLQPKVSTTTNAANNNNNNGPNNNNGASNSSTMTLLLRAEGPALTELTMNQILPHFQTALQRHQMIVAEAEARRLQRQEEQALRQQQDEEYQAALLADQERERAQREEAEREAERVQEEQRAQERQEAEAAAALQTARDKVPVEPPATAATGSITTIRFVLPSGAKLNRRFYSNESIAGLLAFLTIYFHDKEMDISKNIGLSTNFPKKSYNDDPTQTLEEAGLTPQAVLMVQDLDA